MMRLHYHPLSPYSRKASVAVAMHGAPVELKVIELGSGGLRRPEFLALSPFGKMPVLETDGGPVVESTSIIDLLEETYGRVLLPVGSERVARHFDRLGDLYLTDPVAALWWEPETPAGRGAAETAGKAWVLFEKQLAGRAFVAGDRFTLGDLSAAISTDYLDRLGVHPPEPIRAWRDRCFAIPAMAQSLAEALPFVERTLAGRAARARSEQAATTPPG